jgi:tetratricopeptide (TPR) repeat protein
MDFEAAARFANACGAYATTIDACRIGLARDPGNAMLHVYRACAYDEVGRLDEAVADCEAALRIAPRAHSAVLALITLALVHERRGDPAAAVGAARAAVAVEPGDREAHAALGTLLAWHGDWAAAWPELEGHWLDERLLFRRRFPDVAEWNGEDIAGRRLLIVHDQGLGDLIQAIRYAPQLVERGARVMLECPPQAVELLRGAPGIDEIFANGATPRERFDAYACAMTLPRLCGEDGTAGRTHVPYLEAGAERRALWNARLPARAGGRRIGLVWAGNPSHPNDPRRSIPLETFAPLAHIPNVHWCSLQVGPRAGDAPPAGLSLLRLDGAICDLSDTAAILSGLDLLVAADTGVAHLAGALGVPVWLLLPWRPDWRWSRAARTTPWYPSTWLFHASGLSWTPVVADVAAALSG